MNHGTNKPVDENTPLAGYRYEREQGEEEASDAESEMSKSSNRPFARSGHMARNKLHWDANYAVGLSKQRKVGLDWYEFLCFGSPTA